MDEQQKPSPDPLPYHKSERPPWLVVHGGGWVAIALVAAAFVFLLLWDWR